MTRATDGGYGSASFCSSLLIGAVLFLGPVRQMVAMCQEMMGGVIQEGSALPSRPSAQ